MIMGLKIFDAGIKIFQLRTLQRRNTTTGASAASAALRGGGQGDSLETEAGDTDPGDGVNNELVLR